MPLRGPVKRRNEGAKIETIDRRREVWTLRAQGLSFRQIGEKLSISAQTAWHHCNKAEQEWGELTTDPDILREGLASLHAQISGVLMSQIQDQAQNGQVTVEVDGQGRRTTTTRNWVNPQIAAEASRNLVRLAGLMGLSDQSAEGGNGAQNHTVIMVSPPADGATFEARYSQAPAIDVDTTAAAPDSGRTTAADDQAAAL